MFLMQFVAVSGSRHARRASRSGTTSFARRLREGRALPDQRLCVALHAKTEDPPEVDVLEVNRAKPTQPIVIDDHAFLSPPVDYRLHVGRVPCDDDVCQQGV
jgi:hypothetical protein